MNQPNSQTISSEELAKWIWSKLAARYGNKWTSQWQDQRMMLLAQVEWVSSLSKYQPGQIQQAVHDWMEEWPPTLPELVERLKPVPQAQKMYSLPKPRSKEQAREEIQKVKQYMKMAEKPPEDKEEYREWMNKHRRVLGLRQI